MQFSLSQHIPVIARAIEHVLFATTYTIFFLQKLPSSKFRISQDLNNTKNA